MQTMTHGSGLSAVPASSASQAWVLNLAALHSVQTRACLLGCQAAEASKASPRLTSSSVVVEVHV